MQVSVAFPSCNHDRAQKAAASWLEHGYDVLLWLDCDMPRVHGATCFWGQYPGWYTACSFLAKLAVARGADAVVCAGDDMKPDQKYDGPAIAEECYKLYGNTWVMQPTGDPLRGTDRICGSPWLSLHWIARAYRGMFAMPTWYMQFYGDEEMLNVAKQLCVLHQRADITQHHDHWTRKDVKIEKTEYQTKNHELYWERDKQIFLQRKRRNFPGSELLS